MSTIIKYIRLPFQFAAERLQEELSNLNYNWIAHFNKVHYSGEWSALPLRSAGGSLLNVVPDKISDESYADTELILQCPYIKGIVGLLPGEKRAVRLLKLRPGAVIKEHRDMDLCYEKGEARIHIPITTNPDVSFVLDQEQVTMQAGECWYMNFDLPHSLANNGANDRVHLVVDCIVDEAMRELFDSCAGENIKKIKAREEYTDGEKREMIQRLREMNTQAADTIIRKMESEMADQMPVPL